MKLTIVSLALLVGVASCAHNPKQIGIQPRSKSRFETEWRKYLKLESFKSLAVAGDTAGVYASGYAFEVASQEGAVAEALMRCEERRLEKRVSGTCHTYAIGDVTVPRDGD